MLTLLHFGMILIGQPCTCEDLSTMREIKGGTSALEVDMCAGRAAKA